MPALPPVTEPLAPYNTPPSAEMPRSLIHTEAELLQRVQHALQTGVLDLTACRVACDVVLPKLLAQTATAETFTKAKQTGRWPCHFRIEAQGCQFLKLLDATGCLFVDDLHFEHAQFYDEVSFSKSQCLASVAFEEAHFQHRTLFEHTLFGEWTTFHACTFRGEVLLSDAHFHGDVLWSRASFYNELRVQRVSFSGICSFGGCTFAEAVEVTACLFLGKAYFGSVSFEGDTRFKGVRFAHRADFEAVNYFGNAVFQSVLFGEDAHFWCASFTQSLLLQEITFGGRANFQLLRCLGRTQLEQCYFKAEALFQQASFQHECHLLACTFEQDVSFEQSRWLKPLHSQQVRMAGTLNMAGATLAEGGRWLDGQVLGESLLHAVKVNGTWLMKACLFQGRVSTLHCQLDSTARWILHRCTFGEDYCFHPSVHQGKVLLHAPRFMAQASDGSLDPVRPYRLRIDGSSLCTVTHPESSANGLAKQGSVYLSHLAVQPLSLPESGQTSLDSPPTVEIANLQASSGFTLRVYNSTFHEGSVLCRSVCMEKLDIVGGNGVVGWVFHHCLWPKEPHYMMGFLRTDVACWPSLQRLAKHQPHMASQQYASLRHCLQQHGYTALAKSFGFWHHWHRLSQSPWWRVWQYPTEKCVYLSSLFGLSAGLPLVWLAASTLLMMGITETLTSASPALFTLALLLQITGQGWLLYQWMCALRMR